MPNVIKIENISKQYRLGSIGTNTLRGDLQRWWYTMRGLPDPTLKIGQENLLREAAAENRSDSEYVWALRNINLDIEEGEVLGVIGKNGAGKSTLLKLLSRVTAPTTGSIKVKGRIASLLEVGTGFHPDLTGRENIYLNGAILGMNKHEIKRKESEIIEFSGVAKYVDTPVKRYSSGMYVRLAFAVAAHLEPEVLIIDEVLAVGDIEFQNKALGKIKEVSNNRNRTVLFVSHNMSAVKSLCTRAIVLENGLLTYQGSSDDCINYYIESNRDSKQPDIRDRIALLPDDPVFKLEDALLLQDSKPIANGLYSHLPVDIVITYSIKEKTTGFRLFIDLVDNQEILILRSFFDENENASSVINPGVYTSSVRIPEHLLGPAFYEIRIQAGIYNQRMCMPMDEIGFPFKVENFTFNKAYPNDTFRQKIAPILNWETVKK